jgi:hypothetical protein
MQAGAAGPAGVFLAEAPAPTASVAWRAEMSRLMEAGGLPPADYGGVSSGPLPGATVGVSPPLITPLHYGGVGPAGGNPQAASAATGLKRAVTSPWGVAVLCVLGVFLVSFILLCAIQPPFTYSKPKPEAPLDTDKFDPARAAVGAAIAAGVAALVTAIVAAVRTRGGK